MQEKSQARPINKKKPTAANEHSGETALSKCSDNVEVTLYGNPVTVNGKPRKPSEMQRRCAKLRYARLRHAIQVNIKDSQWKWGSNVYIGQHPFKSWSGSGNKKA